jgi:hypothetical protein
MVKVLFILIGTPLLLASCASPQPAPILTPMAVNVPVATPVYCTVAKLDKPAMPISTLKADSAPADTMRAYAATVAILKGAVEERDSVIAGCAPPADAHTSLSSAGMNAAASSDAK